MFLPTMLIIWEFWSKEILRKTTTKRTLTLTRADLENWKLNRTACVSPWHARKKQMLKEKEKKERLNSIRLTSLLCAFCIWGGHRSSRAFVLHPMRRFAWAAVQKRYLVLFGITCFSLDVWRSCLGFFIFFLQKSEVMCWNWAQSSCRATAVSRLWKRPCRNGLRWGGSKAFGPMAQSRPGWDVFSQNLWKSISVFGCSYIHGGSPRDRQATVETGGHRGD